jgi:hypothetical protein
VRGVERRGDGAALHAESLGDRGVVEVGVVPEKDCQALADVPTQVVNG